MFVEAKFRCHPELVEGRTVGILRKRNVTQDHRAVAQSSAKRDHVHASAAKFFVNEESRSNERDSSFRAVTLRWAQGDVMIFSLRV
jgi:hypothetical protein